MKVRNIDKVRARELVEEYIETGKHGIVSHVIGTEKMDTETLIVKVAKSVANGV